MRETMLVIDGNSLMHRAFHALPLMDADGVYTNAVHGFLSMLIKAVQDVSPRYIAAAFDTHVPTFRHTAYADYKAGRRAMPEELRPQFSVIREILSAMGLGVLSVDGYEADDILGTLSLQCREHGIDCVLLTGDRDALQLVGGGTKVLFTRKGITESTLFDAAGVKEYFSVTPEQVTDWKGLMGDASDNIPGIPGVGEKTAVKLLNEYGTLESVLDHAGEIKGKLGAKIRDNADLARFSKDLATIRPTAPVPFDLNAFDAGHMERGLPVLRKYQLNGVAARLEKLTGGAEDTPAEAGEAQEAFEAEPLASREAIDGFIRRMGEGPAALHVTPTAMTLAFPGHLGEIQLQQDMLSSGLLPEEAWAAMAPLMEKKLCVHDGKSLLHQLAGRGLPLPRFAWDTMLGAYLHNPQEKTYALAHFEREDAAGVLTLAKKQEKLLADEGMLSLMNEIEMPLLYVLFDMEQEGFQVDGAVLRRLGEDFTRQAEALKEEVYALTGVRGFNLNSTQQLGKVLFETLNLPHGKKTQRGYSTDADTLEKLTDAHPCIAPILKYRQVVKLNSTYIDALLRKMDASGRVHSYFDQTGTATGRISSSEPNLQNIPVRTEMGREIRKAFVTRPGYILADADYSQIELRVMAHFSGDEAMVDAFRRGQDIHARTAAEVYGVPMEQVTRDMRSSSKAVNFGLVYGISDFGLARNIGVSRKEAAAFIARYFERYPGVKQYMDDAVKKGYENGCAVTLMGRRRLLPELKMSNANMRSFGERAAMNAPIQGTAADIIKLAMVRVHDALKKEGLRAKLILQVHDELLIEAPREEEEKVAAILKTCMEQVYSLSVPLVADVKTGESWYETK
ncbi:MAG: DNA polymerase I [Clostridiales bacterium]|nr:DNA polymerase I [Clostridiales bacterium]